MCERIDSVGIILTIGTKHLPSVVVDVSSAHRGTLISEVTSNAWVPLFGRRGELPNTNTGGK